MFQDLVSPLGTILKTHGIDGHLIIKCEETPAGLISKKTEWLFIEIDGLLVPFFLLSLDKVSDETIYIQLDGISNEFEAKKHYNHKLFIENKNLLKTKNKSPYFGLLGYQVFDTNKGNIGTVNQLLEYSTNLILEVNGEFGEVLIPASESIILSIDKSKKLINVDLPDGIIGLND